MIPCLNCGGKGWIVVMTLAGLRRPVTCQACGGSGTQEVRPR